MRTISATAFRHRFGEHLEGLAREPVTVEKGGRPVAVVLSIREWERLQALEDAWWAREAEAAVERGFLSPDETTQWLTSRLAADDAAHPQ